MDKALCDRLITEYTKKLYGFALSKTSSIERAEELAAKITLEVYTSLLRRENILNPNAYIYRVAQNVYARFTDEYKNSPYCEIGEVIASGDIPDGFDFVENLAEEAAAKETYAKLRLEIAYLSRIRREILVRHYYQNMKLSEIAAELSIPVGTVKWHLSGAKNSLKEGMNKMRTVGKLGIAPIEMTNLGHSGNPGTKGDTANFLEKRLTQNIAWAAYQKPLGINEIADELGVSPIFVEDEVKMLEEYGFMDKIGEKYLTNMYILEPSEDVAEAEQVLSCEYAAKIADVYVPRVIEALNVFDRSKLYIPNDDKNLFMWSGILFALSYKFSSPSFDNIIEKFRVKRKDGGDYIAFANIKRDINLSFKSEKYDTCGNMARGSNKYPIYSWQLDTFYDSRKMSWRDNLYTDYEYLYEFYTGALKKESAQIEKYKRICDKGYITADEKVNLICVDHGGAKWFQDTELYKSLPELDEELKSLIEEISKKIYSLYAPRFPEHIRPLVKLFSTPVVRMHVAEILLERGILKLPSKEQSYGLTTLLFTDKLPE